MPHPTEAPSDIDRAVCRSSGTPCAACRKSAGDLVPVGTLHSYTSTPRGGWQARYAPGEDAATAPTFGVELETMAAARVADLPNAAPWGSPEWHAWQVRNRDHHARRGRGRLTVDEACATAAPRGQWHPKHDGSVTGPEFASQPATLAYWRSIRPQVAAMMRALVHGGLRSHDSGAYSCSMHVNIGVASFDRGDRAGHLARFARLVTANPRWSTRIAQRTHDQVASWARFDRFRTMADCEDWAREIVAWGYANDAHSSVLNASHTGRVEFRLPRGTLRPDRFYGKVEWTASMVEYTRDPANRPNPADYTAWMIAREAEYPEAVALMRELMPARFTRRAA